MTLPLTSTTIPAGSDTMEPSGAAVLAPGDLMFRGTSYGVWLSGFNLQGLNAAWARLNYHMQALGVDDYVLSGAYRAPFLMGGAPAYGAQVYGATMVATSWRQPGSEYTWAELLADLRSTYAAAAPSGGELGATAWVWDSESASGGGASSTSQAVQNAAETAITTAGNAGQAVLHGVQGATTAATGLLNAAANAANGLGAVGNAASSLNPVLTFALVLVLVAGGVYVWRELK